MVNLALLFNPSTPPLERRFLARKSFRISARCERSVLATGNPARDTSGGPT